MPNRMRSLLLACVLASAVYVAACGGDDEPDPSIPRDNAESLLSSIEEIEANVDVGSCFVAGDRAETLISEIEDLPDSVDGDVRSALENGANNLRLLLGDPDQCEARTTTTEPTTTEEERTTTEEERTTTEEETTTRPPRTQTTTTTPTQPTTPTVPSGGVEPGSPGGL